MHDIYLAAQFQRKEEMRMYRRQLERYGYRVTSRWLDVPFENPNEHPQPLVMATLDVQDMNMSDTMLIFSNGDGSQSTGGRHTEFGFALGRGITTILIGPHENVFHALAMNNFPNWAIFEEWLATQRNQEVYPHGGRHG